MKSYRTPLLTAADIMNVHVLSLAPETPVIDAVQVLLEHGYSGAPVVDGNGKLLGVFGEIDCLRALCSAAFHVTPSGTVADAMTQWVQTVDPGTDLLRLTTMLDEGHVRRLPVIDHGRIVGLVTRRDVLQALDRLRDEREQEGHRPGGEYRLETLEARRAALR